MEAADGGRQTAGRRWTMETQDGLSSLSDDPEAIPRREAFSGGLSEAEKCKDLW
jgi:predicted secreted protein